MMLDWTGVCGVVALVWLACHFLIYVVVLRNMPLFQTERGIFLYHLASTAVFVVAALVIFLIRRDGNAFSVACALIAAHGIYSISFLELWSLAQGSYSLSIMGQGRSDRVPSRAELVDSFSRIGNAKKADRLSGLEGSKLIRLDGNHWRLTGSGAIVASMLRSLLWLANIKERG
jgi:hypothetical protein